MAKTVGVIERQIQEIGASLEDMQASRLAEAERIWAALGALAGLDGIAAGMAEVGELLAPLRQLVPPSTALPLENGVPEALQRIRAALGVAAPGVPDRDTNFGLVTTEWDGPVGYIGEVPRPDPGDPDPHRERVA
ncbi:MAG TPA: hypothetical protein VGF54_01380 [Streptosporangiaceae bacterium]